MMSAAEHDSRDAIFQRASEWVARLEAPDCSSAERDAFEGWLAQHPEHVRAWAQAEALHQQAEALASDAWARASTARIARPPQPRWWPRVAMAAGICLAVAGGWLVAIDGNPTPRQYANAERLPQQLTLADGSVATLDAGSALSTRFGWRARHITLERGRIQLQVAASSRTLRVHAGNSTIRDIGTTFQVERADDGSVTVALLEGAVDVTSSGTQASQHVLEPGQQLQVADSGRMTPGVLSRPAAEGWLQGQLVFDAAPLQAVVAQMNRYSATPLVITDPAIAALAVSGTFRAGDADALLSALDQGWSITATQRADGALVLHRTH